MTQTVKRENKISLTYRVVKYCGKIFCIWPKDNNKKWYEWILHEICWWILMINGNFLIIGIIIGTYNFYGDIETFTTVIFIVFEITVIAENMFISFLFKVRRKGLVILVSYLERTLMNINFPEEILFRKYLRRSAPLAVCVYSVYGTLAVGFTYLQLYKPTVILPKEIWHPFTIKSSIKQYVVLFQQLIYIYHTGVIHVSDGLIFMSMHIATAKLQVLSHEFEKVVDENQLRKCIKQHQEIIRFVNEMNDNFCTLIFKTVLVVTFYVILGYLQLLQRHQTYDPVVVYQFFCMVVFVNYRMFFCAKCADELATMGENLRYSMPWAGKTSGLARSMNIIIHRCQKPLNLSFYGIIPAYNLSYYSHFISFTFSYFMTLKAVLEL